MLRKHRVAFGLVAVITVVAAIVTLLVCWALWSRPDPVAALRQRLVGESAQGVEALLGEPAFRDSEDRVWHYFSDAKVRQFANEAAIGGEIIVELDDHGKVDRVYLEK